jgi:hypothetical protein
MSQRLVANGLYENDGSLDDAAWLSFRLKYYYHRVSLPIADDF